MSEKLTGEELQHLWATLDNLYTAYDRVSQLRRLRSHIEAIEQERLEALMHLEDRERELTEELEFIEGFRQIARELLESTRQELARRIAQVATENEKLRDLLEQAADWTEVDTSWPTPRVYHVLPMVVRDKIAQALKGETDGTS